MKNRYIKASIKTLYIGKENPNQFLTGNKKSYEHISLSNTFLDHISILDHDYLNDSFDKSLYFKNAYDAVVNYSGNGIYDGVSRETLFNLIIKFPQIEYLSNSGENVVCQITGTAYATIILPAEEEEKEIIENIQQPDLQPADSGLLSEKETAINDSVHRPSVWKLPSELPSFIRGCLSLMSLLLLLLLMAWFFQNKSCTNNNPVKDRSDTIPKTNDTILLNGNQINIAVYDWDEQDGDIISIYLNDKPVKENVLLSFVPQSYLLNDLKPNSVYNITIKAIEQGKGMTTPTIEIFAGTEFKTFKIRLLKGEPKVIPVFIKGKS